jgi:hypothetical protein
VCLKKGGYILNVKEEKRKNSNNTPIFPVDYIEELQEQ